MSSRAGRPRAATYKLTKGGLTARGWIVTSLVIGASIAAFAGVAMASTFTLRIAKNAPVVNTSGTLSHKDIVTTRRGWAVYALSGDSKSHPKCTKANGCFQFWPPVTVASRHALSKAPGIRGRLTVWRRNGHLQVLLSGHPLYRYSGDHQMRRATGQGIRTFGGTWHVVTPGKATATTTMTTPTTTTPCSGICY